MSLKKERVIQDAEIVEEVGKEEEVRCEIVVGIDVKGNVYYRIAGPDQSLITVEGLLGYANKEMNRLWERSLNASRKAEG